MQKARRALAQIAGRFLFIGISVQIVLGICWMIRAFGIFPGVRGQLSVAESGGYSCM